jgi:hypothetical protein
MLLRKDIRRHVDPINGNCCERFVRCPSNFVGWRVLVEDRFRSQQNPVAQYGIVLKYQRFRDVAEDDIAMKLLAEDNFPPAIKWDGVDRLYIRF